MVTDDALPTLKWTVKLKFLLLPNQTVVVFKVLRFTLKIDTITSGTMQNNNGGNNGHWLKTVTCKQTSREASLDWSARLLIDFNAFFEIVQIQFMDMLFLFASLGFFLPEC